MEIIKSKRNLIKNNSQEIKSRNENNFDMIITSVNTNKNLNYKNTTSSKNIFSRITIKSKLKSNSNQNYSTSSLAKGSENNFSKGLNNINDDKNCEEKCQSQNLIPNKDLLLIVGCNKIKKSDQNLKLNSNFLKNNKDKTIFCNLDNNYKPIKKIENYNESLHQNIIYKPVKIAKTIYKELNQKKIILMNKIKEKQQMLQSGGLTNIYNKKFNKHIKKSSFDVIHSSNNTNYLERKYFQNIPIIFPVFFSFRNEYENQSEKNRQEKIIDKFIQLKTHIINQPENKNILLKEFLIKNGLDDSKNFTIDKLNNFTLFLNHPFNFDPKKSIKEILNEGLNYQATNEELISDQNKLKDINYFLNGEINKKDNLNYSSHFYKKINAFPKTSFYKKKNFNDSIDYEKFNEYLTMKNNFNNKNLKEVISSLEEEFDKIKNEKITISEKVKNKLIQDLKKHKIEDNNKLIPNLCLSSKSFAKLNLKKFNNESIKMRNMINKEDRINEINDRLFYNLKNNSTDKIFMDKIKRRHKLTEYIILNRAKYKFLIETKNKKLSNMPSID